MAMYWRHIWLCLASLSLLFLSNEAGNLPAKNPEKFGSHFEGDMLNINPSGISSGLGAFRDNEKSLWPNGDVYYRLSSTIKANRTKTLMITEAMQDISAEAPCINFIDIEKDNLNIGSFVDIITHGDNEFKVSGLGCHSEVGYQGRRQVLNLQPEKCFHSPTIKHELFHTLGCVHEHSRPDVNQTLNIFINNVKPGMEKNFRVEKYAYEDEDKGIQDFNTPYDIQSIMQYPSNAFAYNDSLKTMQSKDPTLNDNFGSSTDFSVIDVIELNLSYRCSLTTGLIFEYVNSYMEIMMSRRRMDTQERLIDQKRIEKLENQSFIDQKRITKQEEQTGKDQKRMEKLENQTVIDQKRITKQEEQTRKDQKRIEKLENQISKLKDENEIVKDEMTKLKEKVTLLLNFKGCDGGDHGLPCCPEFVTGDMEGGSERYIGTFVTHAACQSVCKVQYPTSIGMTFWKNRCYCEFAPGAGPPVLNRADTSYKTCLFSTV